MSFLRRTFAACAALVVLFSPQLSHAENLKLRVAYVPMVNMAPLFILTNEGWAREAGVDLELTRFSSGTTLIQALASGEFDAVYMAVSPVVVARARGIDLKIVAANGVEIVSLIGLADLARGYDSAASPAKAFEAFRQQHGRPVSIATLPKGTIPDTALRHYIKTQNISEADVSILSQGEEQVRQSLLAKAVDAATMPEPIITIVKSKDPSSELLATGHDLMPGHPGFVLSVREKILKDHPDKVKALVTLNSKAIALIKSDPKRAAISTEVHLGKGLIPLEVIEAALTSPNNPITDDLRQLAEGTKALQQFQVEIGVQPKIVPENELFDWTSYNELQATR
ncbi:ABC transporter substrate-binding protein [Hyphomicrobium sp.]|uniref:ABC transporter substrate-binding protein n=1 Tax=Hyphomicrobium sp. TaxID=82 RepID=UPI002FE3A343